ncbi:DUF805 domain-containing protein [Aureimonas altamirensis]|uniref:DUF805 domain-containing protein n=1 Tax=Aureimonas altamirensis TaxID=370622 RepID=UPI002557646F|nr:DUF805 domain-containing protein [Aureimonas altamirensis]
MLLLLAAPFLFLRYRVPEGPNQFGPPATPVGFLEAVKRFFANYVNFRDRASRSEFWYAMLFYAVLFFLIGFLRLPDIFTTILYLVLLLPLLSVSARRLHDSNRSGWLQLVAFFTPIGTIIAIIWFSKPPSEDHSPSDNRKIPSA